MTSSWIKEISDTLLPISEEKRDIKVAMKEWKNTFEVTDCVEDEEELTNCELCNHPGIRYKSKIQNRFNFHELEIGSICITRFHAETIDDLELRWQEDKKVKNAITAHQEEVRNLRVKKAFRNIGADQSEFVASLYSQNKKKGSLSPKQILSIHADFERFGILKNGDIKMNLKKKDYKQQLKDSKGKSLEILLSYLTPEQLKTYGYLKRQLKSST